MAFSQFCITVLLIISFASAEIKNKGWWKNKIFYQVYPRSFMDSNDDGIGDLKGITSKLEHFVESGIGGIWLSPIYASPMVDFGYDISDFLKVDPIFGSQKDFDELIQKAKRLGIAVILDFVPNHTSVEHEWFIKSVNGDEKYRDYYVWREGRSNNTEPPNNWIGVFGGSAWEYNKNRNLWYFHQFEYRQADLNFSNPDVLKEMEDILIFWLNKGVDGFRIDAINNVLEDEKYLDEPQSYLPGAQSLDYEYLNHIYSRDYPKNYDMVRIWRNLLDNWTDTHDEKEKIIMVEIFADINIATEYYNYGAHIPFNFNFISFINQTSKPSEYKKIIDGWMARTPKDGSANWVMGNHDRKRIASRFPGRADQMTILAMILPGVAVTYYGEEISMVDNYKISWNQTVDPQARLHGRERYHLFTRDPCRTPFQWNDSQNAGFSRAQKTWLPVHDNYKELNLEKQKTQSQSPYKLYQTMSQLRNSSITLKHGTIDVEVLNKETVLSVVRKSLGESIVLFINFSDDIKQEVNASKYFNGATKASVVVASVDSGIKWGSSVKLSEVRIPPKASIVLIAKVQK